MFLSSRRRAVLAKDLWRAALADDLRAVEKLTNAGAPVAYRAENGLDALYAAYDRCNLEMARVLVAAEIRQGGTERPVLCACILGELDAMRRAVSSLAAVQERDGHGLTPLHGLAFCGNPEELVAQLLSAGADVDTRDGEGVTPLIVAARMGHEPIVRRLLEADADRHVRRRTSRGENALEAAVRHHRLAVVETLLSGGARVNEAGRSGSALTVAAAEGDKAALEILLQRGAHVGGCHPLVAASVGDHADIARRLLEAGADPNERLEIAEQGISISPLGNASMLGATETVEVLLAAGAHVDDGGAGSETPLMLVAEHSAPKDRKVAVARALLAAGADVNAVDEQGRTAFWIARQTGHEVLAQLLREAGADVSRTPAWSS